MGVDSPAFVDSSLVVYHAEVRKAIAAEEERLEALRASEDALRSTIDTVAQLPQRMRHDAMVPLGRHAFFEGQLVRANELLVHLGGEYYAETTAHAARGILQRRLAAVEQGVAKSGAQLAALRARLDVAAASLREEAGGAPALEIRTTLEESDALLASAGGGRQRRRPHGSAAARQQRGGPVRRVVSPGGYSYTPLALAEGGEAAGSSDDGGAAPDAEDIALQARLEELMRLEEEHERLEEEREQRARDELWQPQAWQQQQGEQVGGAGGLATIREEAEGGEDAAEGADEGRRPPEAGRAGASLTPAQQLQQLEVETDSDDDEPRGRQLQQQQAAGRRPAAAAAAAAAAGPSSPAQQQVVVVGSSPARAAPAPKSALKKGFLAAQPAKKPSGGGGVDGGGGRVGVRRAGVPSGASSSSNSSSSSSSGSSNAFTGIIVERRAAEAEAVALVPPAPASVQQGPGAGACGKPSKFKLRRMGLDAEGGSGG